MNRITSAKIYHGALSVEVGRQDKEAATFPMFDRDLPQDRSRSAGYATLRQTVVQPNRRHLSGTSRRMSRP